MLRTSITQKQCSTQRNKLITKFYMKDGKLDPSVIIKTMLKIIKIKSNDSMNEETRIHFSKIAAAVIQMAEEI